MAKSTSAHVYIPLFLLTTTQCCIFLQDRGISIIFHTAWLMLRNNCSSNHTGVIHFFLVIAQPATEYKCSQTFDVGTMNYMLTYLEASMALQRLRWFKSSSSSCFCETLFTVCHSAPSSKRCFTARFMVVVSLC